ncbi:hypothetical protein BDQ12DRAFT_349859 [Crucibulum laeve]|uniref:F-box domain-containing protein n=1 Tax=Crucibulum laeve TaxID=68775 RepID=A0A5C3MB61_9AGAR|nr:hypothetical protein BDQ12DRAFT_349859 [Crucibulum laeve]
MPIIAELPTELYSSILNHVPQESLQQTVLSLTRALPFSPIPLFFLFQCIRLTHAEQVVLLHRTLRTKKMRDDQQNSVTSWVREFSLESWLADADVVINLLRQLPKLKSLSLWIGPNNFSPEHLEELFAKPIPGLKYLSLRFRPYVQKATYYQFLKGAYFDSTLLALSQWPRSSLPTMSIVQDPLDPGVSSTQAFAQPIVFFRLDAYLPLLIHSPSMSESLISLRLRIPMRPVARSLCVNAFPRMKHDYESFSIPALKYLDLSTCGVLETEIDMILARFKVLKHLLLDGCKIFRGEMREGEWTALGKRCALVGVRRAKEREKKLKAWLEANAVAVAQNNGNELPYEVNANIPARRQRRGRRGVATATISLRERDEAATSTSRAPQGARPTIPKMRILPPLPSLQSLAATPSSLVKRDKFPMIRAEFEAGWAEGIAQLAVTRARMQTSSDNGWRILKFGNEIDDAAEEGLDGLEDVSKDENEAFGMPVKGIGAPVLCLVGSERDEEHEKDCGHSMGWDIWKDEL